MSGFFGGIIAMAVALLCVWVADMTGAEDPGLIVAIVALGVACRNSIRGEWGW